MDWQRCRYLAEFLVFRTLVCLVQAFSLPRCRRMSEGLAAFVFYVLPRKLTRYEVARTNLRTAFGDRYSDQEIETIVYKMWVHLFCMVAEIIHMPRKLRLNAVVETFDFRDKDQVVKAMCSGRPVLLLSGHFGNWEMAISIFGLFGFRMGLVARDLDNPYLNRWMLQFRRYTGHKQIAKSGGFDDMVKLLENNGNLALLADQDAGPNGVFVDFFGKSASTHKSIALMALEYNALICVGYACRLENQSMPNGWPRYEFGCEEVVDPLEFTNGDAVREITERYTAALQRAICRFPEQYFWVHRRWKSVPKVRANRKAGPQKLAG